MGKKKKAADKSPTVGTKPFHHVQLRCFVHATEDREKVQRALAFAGGFAIEDPEDMKRFDRVTTAINAEGHFRNPITILETELTRTADVRRFWAALLGPEGTAERLGSEVDQRLDDDLVLWIRLDKQRAAGGGFRLTSGEDVVQVRAKLATYPKDRDVGLAFLRDFFASGGNDQVPAGALDGPTSTA